MLRLPHPAIQAGLIGSFVVLLLLAAGILPAGLFSFLGSNPAQIALYILIGLAVIHAGEALFAGKLAAAAGLPTAPWMAATFAYGVFAIRELKKVVAEKS